MSLKLVTIIVLITALMVQTVAYSAMACDMHSTNQSDVSMDHSMMNHMDMAHHEMMEQSPSHDCCDTETVCPMTACGALVYLSTEVEFTSQPLAAGPQIKHLVKRPSTTSLSFFKPPIIA